MYEEYNFCLKYGQYIKKKIKKKVLDNKNAINGKQFSFNKQSILVCAIEVKENVISIFQVGTF